MCFLSDNRARLISSIDDLTPREFVQMQRIVDISSVDSGHSIHRYLHRHTGNKPHEAGELHMVLPVQQKKPSPK